MPSASPASHALYESTSTAWMAASSAVRLSDIGFSLVIASPGVFRRTRQYIPAVGPELIAPAAKRCCSRYTDKIAAASCLPPGPRCASRIDRMSSCICSHVTDRPGWLVSGLRVSSGIGKVIAMRVFVAGGTGVIGRQLVPQLAARGHQVTATTTSAAKLGLLEQLGAEGVVMDGLDAASVGEAVAAARPDAIVNEMTALAEVHAGKPDLRNPDRFFAGTNRLRSEGTDHLLAAAQ